MLISLIIQRRKNLCVDDRILHSKGKLVRRKRYIEVILSILCCQSRRRENPLRYLFKRVLVFFSIAISFEKVGECHAKKRRVQIAKVYFEVDARERKGKRKKFTSRHCAYRTCSEYRKVWRRLSSQDEPIPWQKLVHSSSCYLKPPMNREKWPTIDRFARSLKKEGRRTDRASPKCRANISLLTVGIPGVQWGWLLMLLLIAEEHRRRIDTATALMRWMKHRRAGKLTCRGSRSIHGG